MEITNSFEIPNKYYVYEGLCDNIETKWITKNKWDKQMNVKFNGTEIIYKDNFGDQIIVLEKNEPDWDKYTDCKFNPNSKCNCLSIDYTNREKYIDYVSNKYDITDKLLHTLYLSDREQLRSFIKHYYNFDINDLD